MLLVGVVTVTGCQRAVPPAAAPLIYAAPPAAPTPAPTLPVAPQAEERPSGPAPPADCWGRRLHGVKAALLPDLPDEQAWRERLAKAMEVLLHDGRAKARVGLRRILKRTTPDQPERLFAAFALAYADLDYEQGRDILFRYLRSWGPDKDVQAERDSWNRQNEQDPFRYGGDDTAHVLYVLYQRHPDRLILQRLMEAIPWADGGGAEVLYGVLEEAATDHTHDFVRALSHVSPEAGRNACRGLGNGSNGGDPQRVRESFQAEAHRQYSGYPRTVRRALQWFEEGQEATRQAAEPEREKGPQG